MRERRRVWKKSSDERWGFVDDSVPVRADKVRKRETLGASDTSGVPDRRDQRKLAFLQIRHAQHPNQQKGGDLFLADL